jgi:hypothetical protein
MTRGGEEGTRGREEGVEVAANVKFYNKLVYLRKTRAVIPTVVIDDWEVPRGG